MFFFIKRSKVVVDAFTCNISAYDYFPIDTANKHMPKWWKNTPKYTKDVPYGSSSVLVPGNTVRRCAGIIDYYKKDSFVIPLWSDLALDYGPQDYNYVFADGRSKLIHHEQDMRGEFMSEYEHFKLASPWKLYEKSGIKFHFSQLFYNFEDPGKIILPPAILNFKLQHATEINFMVKRPICINRLNMAAGTPLVLLTPLTEKDVSIKTHLVSAEEYQRKSKATFAFNNEYFKIKKLKCPFHDK